jgi:predicted RNase H-like nuclease
MQAPLGVFNGRVSESSEIDALVGGALRALGRAFLWVDSAVDRVATGLGDLVVEISPDRPTVLGVDGCRAGWVGVVVSGGTATAVVAPTIAALVATVRTDHPDLAVIGIDIPIGLPDTAPRQADLLARQRLPAGRKSSVFPAPTRLATAATTHVEASAANREATGVGLSIQAFRLVPKILEVDAYVRSPRTCRIIEVHPEVSFAAMDAASVVPAKRTAAGVESRECALRAAGIEPPPYVRGQGYAADDLLDACAAAWTAARAAGGDAETLPDPPETFTDSLPAAIWV